MYTNAVSAFAAGTGSKESNAVASTSECTATSGKIEADKKGSCAPSTFASTVYFEELPIVQSTCSAAEPPRNYLCSGVKRKPGLLHY